MWFLLCSALLCWIVALATLPRYLRHRQDARVTGYWHTVVLIALSLTFSVPSVYVAFDTRIRLPNAARWISNTLLLLAAYTIEGFFFALAHTGYTPQPPVPAQGEEAGSFASSPKARRWLLISLLVTVGTMAVLLWRAGLRADSPTFLFPQVIPALIVYRLLFLSYFAVVVIRYIAQATQYRRLTPDRSVRIGMGLSRIGGYGALLYVLLNALLVLMPNTTPEAKVVYDLLLTAIAVAVSFTMVGSTFPLWAHRTGALALSIHLATALSCWRLGQLWRPLTTAVPEVVLPIGTTWREALFHPAEMELLLSRRVIEILDARRVLLAPERGPIIWNGDGQPPDVYTDEHSGASEIAARMSSKGMRRAAHPKHVGWKGLCMRGKRET